MGVQLGAVIFAGRIGIRQTASKLGPFRML